MTHTHSAANALQGRPPGLHFGPTPHPTSPNLGPELGRSIDCPRCDRTTTLVSLGSIEVDVCSGGCGVWFDAGEMAAMREIASEASGREPVLTIPEELRIAAKPRAVEYLSCPLCPERMSRRYFRHRSAIVFDQCPTHGAWLSQEDALCLMAAISGGAAQPELDPFCGERMGTDLESRTQHLESLIDQRAPRGESLDLQERIHAALLALGLAEA